MAKIESGRLEDAPLVRAPDGSDIRILPAVDGGSMVHASLSPGAITRAVFHRTVEETWYCLSGHGRLWRSMDGRERVIDLEPGVGANIPLGTRFQFRNDGDGLLEIVIATMPPWPGEPGNGDAVECDGPWNATV
ncbi:MAG: cupin domain-containing protein [Chloroflexi bacterium]|nr:cupin domain-containing protein [Chloroflexota bacterium]